MSPLHRKWRQYTTGRVDDNVIFLILLKRPLIRENSRRCMHSLQGPSCTTLKQVIKGLDVASHKYTRAFVDWFAYICYTTFEHNLVLA